ncbi:class I SAM-dependent methyltransferase [Mycobacterium sp. 1423905.2]|uniref:class I SAM-dependent methyltransferase n=1 Tax=Mycobacterium sp. 1423905.2 TaxID=1856859 RepID=UPI000801D433|nr:class I SAM-dependent methyltransferase [Mycobacterium sp. 1423905.2]OBJ50943.1 methyltransferase type 11 [Mycobacterium sp. 1423905.2]
MPRGGPNASWLDRQLQTQSLEYLDRDDVPDDVKQKVIRMLDRFGTLTKQHKKYARAALAVVSDVPNPRILELGAGHGKLCEQILALHPTATVTVSDLDPTSLARIAAGPLGAHPRARTQQLDATAIDAGDHSYDLVVFALALHHLPPAIACRAIAEATRVGERFLVIDLKRRNPIAVLLTTVLMLPINALFWLWPATRPAVHDGFISSLRAYSVSALQALAHAADPTLQTDQLPPPTRFGPPLVSVVYARTNGAGRRV